MRIGLVHNEYGRFSGEESAVENLAQLLTSRGHTVPRFTRSSAELGGGLSGKLRGFVAGIHNPFAARDVAAWLGREQLDIVHVHNLFPLISPAVLPVCTRHNIPVVMTLHNFRLVCPNALLLRNGVPCHDCLGGREWWCVLRNCEGGPGRSAGYALRTAAARRSRVFHRHVSRFLCLTAHQRDIYISCGFPADRLCILPNSIPPPAQPQDITPAADGRYVLYVGRVSPEKDVPTLLRAAERCPSIPFKIAGSFERMPELPATAPANVEFLGQVPHDELADLYRGARLLVFATRCYEGFPTVLLEAMTQARPAVCTSIGGLPEIVRDGVSGLLYRCGDAEDLTAKTRQLWDDPSRLTQLGAAAREQVRTEYGADLCYDRLMKVYTDVQS